MTTPREGRTRHRSVYIETWESLRGFSPETRLVALYLEAGPSASMSGLYAIPPIDIADGTGIPIPHVETSIVELEMAGRILYDRARFLVFVRGAGGRQLGYWPPNAKHRAGIIDRAKDFPASSPCVRALIEELGSPGGSNAGLQGGSVSEGVSGKGIGKDIPGSEMSDGKEPEPEKEKDIRRRFAPPALMEVEAYCRERRNGIDPATFLDFYQAKGWKVGNTPMKDWKAAVRTWEKRGQTAKRTSLHAVDLPDYMEPLNARGN